MSEGLSSLEYIRFIIDLLIRWFGFTDKCVKLSTEKSETIAYKSGSLPESTFYSLSTGFGIFLAKVYDSVPTLVMRMGGGS